MSHNTENLVIGNIFGTDTCWANSSRRNSKGLGSEGIQKGDKGLGSAGAPGVLNKSVMAFRACSTSCQRGPLPMATCEFRRWDEVLWRGHGFAAWNFNHKQKNTSEKLTLCFVVHRHPLAILDDILIRCLISNCKFFFFEHLQWKICDCWYNYFSSKPGTLDSTLIQLMYICTYVYPFFPHEITTATLWGSQNRCELYVTVVVSGQDTCTYLGRLFATQGDQIKGQERAEVHPTVYSPSLWTVSNLHM